MASTSSFSCVPNYDVFLSFRGKDTRYSFTDHLYHALVRAALRTFRDNDEIDTGQELTPEIEIAITESRASIVVLSANYANSRWCLDELLLIIEQRRKCRHFVLPVFYHVDPSDVRNQRGRFAIDVNDDGVEGSKWIEAKMNRWKEALAEIANLNGMVVSGYETDFITKIVDTVYRELDLKLLSTPAHLTAIETRAECINSWLNDEQTNNDVLAICGMGGGGKTTLAQHIYNSNKHKFESGSFLQEIGKHYNQPYGLLELQKQLLSDILGKKNITISNVIEGTSKIEAALQIKKVLLILDDIVEDDELAALLGTKVFHTQSKIIITTRRLDIHAWFESISWRCRVHKLKLLNVYESLNLLSWHAFGEKTPIEGFEELAVELARYCEGNPLALKVLGSSLYVSAIDRWTRNSVIEIWISKLNSLNSFKGDIDCKIQGVLQKSFNSLPLSSHRELFLHIACFFIGVYEKELVTILEDDYHAKSGIMTLINRCLLTISPKGKLEMHQLLQDMGRNIICGESKDPAKRSRVWHDDEAYYLLRKGKGSRTIEGLALDIRKVEQRMKSEPLVLKTASFIKMKNLKLLQLKYVEPVGSYKRNFPDLRYLCWHGIQMKRVPSGLLMSSLVAINMSYGEFEKFEPPMVLNSLKYLNLKGCEKLVRIQSLHRLPKLEILILRLCSSLTHLCKTIGSLESLSELDLAGCAKLFKVLSKTKYVKPERQKTLCIGGGVLEESLIILPRSLKVLDLAYCDLDYHSHVYVVFHVQSFLYLSLSYNLFEFLPNSIDVKTLRVLNLTSCPNLKSVLCIPSTLEELYTPWCRSLEIITFQSARYRLLKFRYDGCFKLCEIQGLFKLVPISEINEADLGHMKWIKAYEDHEVDLVGNYITEGRIWRIQMLYEYGIRSTFLQSLQDQSIPSGYISSSSFFYVYVPRYPDKRKIRGLNVTALYRSSGPDKFVWLLFAKIINITKGLTWIYNPVVYVKPIVDEDILWISYWPIGSILEAGDEVNVSIIVGNGMVVSGCGASLVYIDDSEVEQGETWKVMPMVKK